MQCLDKMDSKDMTNQISLNLHLAYTSAQPVKYKHTKNWCLASLTLKVV